MKLIAYFGQQMTIHVVEGETTVYRMWASSAYQAAILLKERLNVASDAEKEAIKLLDAFLDGGSIEMRLEPGYRD